MVATKKLFCRFHKLEPSLTTGGFQCGSLTAPVRAPIRMVPQPQLRPRAARILVVEDEALFRVLIAEELRLEGFSVIEADRADDALTYLEPASKWIWYSQISGRPARSTGCNWLKYSVINIPTFPSFSRQEMPRQGTSE